MAVRFHYTHDVVQHPMAGVLDHPTLMVADITDPALRNMERFLTSNPNIVNGKPVFGERKHNVQIQSYEAI
jgi:hypothetical protein